MTQEKHMSTISTMTKTMLASGTSNGVYISSPIQHNNILRSHQLFFTATYDKHLCDDDEDMYDALRSLSTSRVPPNDMEQMIYPASYTILRSHRIVFPEEEGDRMRQDKHMLTMSTTMTTTTVSGTSNGANISSPIQHNNILRSHQIIYTATDDQRICDDDEDNADDYDSPSLDEASNSHVPPNCLEKMINPGSRFTFVAKQLSKKVGEPFRHFLNLSIVEDVQIAEAYRCICLREGFCFHNEEMLTKEGPNIMVVFNFADEMIPVAVKMWKPCLSKDQNVPIDSCIRIMCQR